MKILLHKNRLSFHSYDDRYDTLFSFLKPCLSVVLVINRDIKNKEILLQKQERNNRCK